MHVLYALSLLIFLILLVSGFIKPRMTLLPGVPPEIKEEAEKFAAAMKAAEEAEFLDRKIEKDYPPDYTELDLVSEFDPNTASREILLKAGITRHGVNSLLAYREAGGRFRSAGDLEKIYGISKESVLKLHSRIRIDSSFLIPDQKLFSEREEEVHYERMDINLAEFNDFISLPGVDGKLAARILKYRELLGGFHDPGQLREVYEMPDSLIVNFDSLFHFTHEKLKALPLHQGEYAALLRHPYLDRKQVDALLELRRFSKEEITQQQLKESGIFETGHLQRVLPYLPEK